MSRSYFEFVSDLENIYIEDSFVLGIYETDSALFFDLEAVLNETHPDYSAPPADIRYCYCKARLMFSGHLAVNWVERNFKSRSVDADGTVDIGEIDSFTCWPDGYYLDGSWGAVKIKCDNVSLTLR